MRFILYIFIQTKAATFNILINIQSRLLSDSIRGESEMKLYKIFQ